MESVLVIRLFYHLSVSVSIIVSVFIIVSSKLSAEDYNASRTDTSHHQLDHGSDNRQPLKVWFAILGNMTLH